MSKFKLIVDYFNSKKSNKIFTRAEYYQYCNILFSNKKYRSDILTKQSIETYRCILMEAGFLKQEELGVYRKMKKIPEGLTYSQALKLAYPK